MSVISRTDKLGENQELFENKEGFIIYRLDEDYCEIDFIRVDKDMFRNGSGSKLLQEFKLYMIKSHKVTEFTLDAVVQNENIMSLDKLIAFYKKNGFEVSERFEMDEVERAIMFQEIQLKKEKVPTITPTNIIK